MTRASGGGGGGGGRNSEEDDDGALSDVSDPAVAPREAQGCPATRNRKCKYGLRRVYLEKKKVQDELKNKQKEEEVRRREEERKQKEAERMKRHAQGDFSSDEEDGSGLSDMSAEEVDGKGDGGQARGRGFSSGGSSSSGGGGGGSDHSDSETEGLTSTRSPRLVPPPFPTKPPRAASPTQRLKRLSAPALMVPSALISSHEADGIPTATSPAGGGFAAVRSLQSQRAVKKRVSWSPDPQLASIIA